MQRTSIMTESGPGEDEIANKWPLHWMIWNNDHKGLNRLLEQKVVSDKLIMYIVSHVCHMILV